jgi:hypothetical protein
MFSIGDVLLRGKFENSELQCLCHSMWKDGADEAVGSE